MRYKNLNFTMLASIGALCDVTAVGHFCPVTDLDSPYASIGTLRDHAGLGRTKLEFSLYNNMSKLPNIYAPFTGKSLEG